MKLARNRSYRWIALVAFCGVAIGVVIRFGLPKSSWLPTMPPQPSSVAETGTAESRGAFYRTSFNALRRRHPASARDRIEMLKLLDAWLRAEPLDCVSHLESLGALNLVDGAAITLAFEQASKADAALAMRMAAEVRSPMLRDRLVSAAFRRAIAKEPTSALNLYGHVPEHLNRSLGTELGEALGKNGSPKLMMEILRHAYSSDTVIDAAMETWVGVNTNDALDFLEKVDPFVLKGKGTSAPYIWDKLNNIGDPVAKLQFFEKQPESQERNFAIVESLGSLIADDPRQWQEWERKLKVNVKLAAVAHNAAVKAGKTNPENVLAILDQIPGERSRSEAAKQATRSMLFRSGVKEPQYVFEWYKKIQDPIVAHAVVEELRFQNVPMEEVK